MWECADLLHHEVTREKCKLGDRDWFEVEWDENDKLTVRVCERSENSEQFYADCIRGLWKSQAACVRDLIKRVCKHGGSLDLSGTQIKELPEGLNVGGYLDLSGTKITKDKVPNKLKDKCVW